MEINPQEFEFIKSTAFLSAMLSTIVGFLYLARVPGKFPQEQRKKIVGKLPLAVLIGTSIPTGLVAVISYLN
ncbi:hypothetical protein A2954_06625 [Candidatus Roizmanbacteria bacterium RIFCSPLOWO2_01_FULL_37_12]|uniref:Uncharacterized protein n=1 Tax=Candidatus Roizmanbacteria bacterium RIFCSPLOWO2_01_FULL_37_12 TaxID=1802056 RepID=A0A1F7I8P9_9BACT|nr:MAG: hypothetical protein A2768_00340 [Candidatus Roizmanbacteria bacterium RIFCSPHIGHO2_01_FULL_37_16]OGK24698.1 MAG: hypothetical protein A3D76_02925 [Candidatus Roizmanbacteria bacterium RIFCSPHIGHO2_02_FULL_37_9b]OGK39682.1 MAG: hypothetical protein A2954_06625 [Candidatus Roizmanbacteria bacterium RIFCSPLOWO2_01_FULL_37_12]